MSRCGTRRVTPELRSWNVTPRKGELLGDPCVVTLPPTSCHTTHDTQLVLESSPPTQRVSKVANRFFEFFMFFSRSLFSAPDVFFTYRTPPPGVPISRTASSSRRALESSSQSAPILFTCARANASSSSFSRKASVSYGGQTWRRGLGIAQRVPSSVEAFFRNCSRKRNAASSVNDDCSFN